MDTELPCSHYLIYINVFYRYASEMNVWQGSKTNVKKFQMFTHNLKQYFASSHLPIYFTISEKIGIYHLLHIYRNDLNIPPPEVCN